MPRPKKEQKTVWVVTSAVEPHIDEVPVDEVQQFVEERLRQLSVPPSEAESSGLISVFDGKRLSVQVGPSVIKVE